MGGKGWGRVGTCELQVREEGGEADKGGYTGGQTSGHRAHASWVNMLLCARWKVTHLFSLLGIFFKRGVWSKLSNCFGTLLICCMLISMSDC